MDSTHIKIDATGLEMLERIAHQSGIQHKIQAMFAGDKINTTENRAVLHVALRKPKGEACILDGKDIMPQVHQVNDRI